VQYTNNIIWQNAEKCKQGKAAANHVFSNPTVGIFMQGDPLWRYTIYVFSGKKFTAILPS
jgi:hypothetical protein